MNILASYSIKGGVGKTALAVNLAYAFGRRGHRTLLVDLDPQGAAAFYFRVSPAESFKMTKGDKMGDLLRHNIRESDYPGLDVLPSNLAYRNFDIMLDRLKKSQKQLSRMLRTLKGDYDTIVLDCPPNITLLSENVFIASDLILVPVIPTTLSERTLHQLFEFFDEKKMPEEKIVPFFSMVQTTKTMHRELLAELPGKFPAFLQTSIPFTVEVEKMGLFRQPLEVHAPNERAAKAYHDLSEEILSKLRNGK